MMCYVKQTFGYFFVIVFFFSCKSYIILPSGAKFEKSSLKDDWKNSPKSLSTKCDTLILYEVCSYCNNIPTSEYFANLSSTSCCLCYEQNKYFAEKINQYICERRQEIKIIIIQNPSNIIFELNFKGLRNIQTLSVIGDDLDKLKTLPIKLLSNPTMKYVRLNNVSFPQQELERLKIEFPKISFEGGLLY